MMKKCAHILTAVILALVTMYLGAGVAFVHICSTCCSQKHCIASAAQEAEKENCSHCKKTASENNSSCCHLQQESACTCMDITYQVDFFHQLSQQALSVVAQLPVELPMQTAVPQPSVSELLSCCLAPNAPPAPGGRTLLCLHSILVI